MKKASQTTTTVTPFALVLPTELTSITPRWTVDLPAKHKALIFDTTTNVEDYKDGQRCYREAPAYRAVLVNGKGHPTARRVALSNIYGRATFTDLLDLKLALERCALDLTPKTTTSRRSREYDEDDLGEDY
jgi:hypothetical protein